MKQLSAKGLRVRLGDRLVLDDVSATFDAGNVTAILGPNGAGKSTLLTCLAGLLKPARGSVKLGDESLDTLPSRLRAQRIGFLPQLQEIAWSVDVATLVALGRLPHRGFGTPTVADQFAVEQALHAVGLTDFADRVATSLSGGERARALLARVLAGEPPWLLADEPLTGLDVGYQLDACKLLRRIASAGIGVVLTLHDLQLAARVADRILLLRDGKIVADAAPAEALTTATIKQVYGVDSEITTGAHGLVIDVVGRA
ncbi:ABC transporter ATP-binding protein [Roseiterribacter gracilis]|uniref:ABC transporter n=1 Tax=Roseiterribacter gracilis TaxID=2812848 RepID=A0A8S8X6E3_9PROT|nr:ABC transporter [Rhodospirillales bacterium TMPK1]